MSQCNIGHPKKTHYGMFVWTAPNELESRMTLATSHAPTSTNHKQCNLANVGCPGGIRLKHTPRSTPNKNAQHALRCNGPMRTKQQTQNQNMYKHSRKNKQHAKVQARKGCIRKFGNTRRVEAPRPSRPMLHGKLRKQFKDRVDKKLDVAKPMPKDVIIACK